MPADRADALTSTSPATAVADRPRRVVSLLPSATEIVHVLGAGDRLVGVTFECDHPATARTDAAVVVGGVDTAGMTPAEIDASVRSRAAAGEDLYTLHEGALRGIDPDLVLTQDLCRVCALPSDVVDEALAHLGCTADVLALDPSSLDDVLGTVLTVGDALGVPEQAAAVVASLRARLAAVAAAVAGRPRPRVAVVEWVDPPFVAGHWVPDLVVAAGGEEVCGLPGARSVTTTWADVVAAAPDVVVVAPCGYHLDAAAEQALVVADALAAAGLPGVPVWAVDADGLVVRPGPRLVDGVEALAGLLHPDILPLDPAAVRRVR
ncbi:ABC transporter substrate-binding protein [Aquipuribacter hungaricus]|uniref:ABC transporter substrate-binding protein n=1 Tax=Aquipuribacter hungaricus TaxID=545624 RepID=A0ABV7WFL0_9MICO